MTKPFAQSFQPITDFMEKEESRDIVVSAIACVVLVALSAFFAAASFMPGLIFALVVSGVLSVKTVVISYGALGPKEEKEERKEKKKGFSDGLPASFWAFIVEVVVFASLFMTYISAYLQSVPFDVQAAFHFVAALCFLVALVALVTLVTSRNPLWLLEIVLFGFSTVLFELSAGEDIALLAGTTAILLASILALGACKAIALAAFASFIKEHGEETDDSASDVSRGWRSATNAAAAVAEDVGDSGTESGFASESDAGNEAACKAEPAPGTAGRQGDDDVPSMDKRPVLVALACLLVAVFTPGVIRIVFGVVALFLLADYASKYGAKCEEMGAFKEEDNGEETQDSVPATSETEDVAEEKEETATSNREENPCEGSSMEAFGIVFQIAGLTILGFSFAVAVLWTITSSWDADLLSSVFAAAVFGAILAIGGIGMKLASNKETANNGAEPCEAEAVRDDAAADEAEETCDEDQACGEKVACTDEPAPSMPGEDVFNMEVLKGAGEAVMCLGLGFLGATLIAVVLSFIALPLGADVDVPFVAFALVGSTFISFVGAVITGLAEYRIGDKEEKEAGKSAEEPPTVEKPCDIMERLETLAGTEGVNEETLDALARAAAQLSMAAETENFVLTSLDTLSPDEQKAAADALRQVTGQISANASVIADAVVTAPDGEVMFSKDSGIEALLDANDELLDVLDDAGKKLVRNRVSDALEKSSVAKKQAEDAFSHIEGFGF